MGKDWADVLTSGEMTPEEFLAQTDAAWSDSEPAGPDRDQDAPPPESSHFSDSNGHDQPADLGEWDAGDDDAPIQPRGWLLGNIFCRRFVSSLIADGGVGKTALRIPQLLSLACGRPLVGDHVFQRCRVLIISLEDDRDELRRRVRAARLHHGVSYEDIKGWLFLAAPGGALGKLMISDDKGHPIRSTLAYTIEQTIESRSIDVVSLDPFVKAHAIDENSNSAIDEVMQVLTDLATSRDIAVDVPHHTSKGLGDAGNANRGRGASAMKDAARLVTHSPQCPKRKRTPSESPKPNAVA